MNREMPDDFQFILLRAKRRETNFPNKNRVNQQ
jgi:hypothetical protein